MVLVIARELITETYSASNYFLCYSLMQSCMYKLFLFFRTFYEEFIRIIKRCVENRCSVLRDENLRQRVKGRECNSPLSRRASVERLARGVGTVSRGVVEVPGASSPESKEVRNVFMIFPG